MQLTHQAGPGYFHKVVDCQWACPAHTPVPEYIRLIAQGRYDDAYMVNWVSNVFPGILGRTCDRPCEPACRRGRVEDENLAKPEPVAICRLKRVAADFKGPEVRARIPVPKPKNGKKVACVGAGPSSLTVARDLASQGYAVTVFDGETKPGGFIRSQIPRFRLPETVIDEETGYILDLGVQFRSGQRIDSMNALLAEGYDAIFVGCGAPRGRGGRPLRLRRRRPARRGRRPRRRHGHRGRRLGLPRQGRGHRRLGRRRHPQFTRRPLEMAGTGLNCWSPGADLASTWVRSWNRACRAPVRS